MKRPSHLQVVPDHESSHLRELLRVKDQELKGIYYTSLIIRGLLRLKLPD